MKPIRDERGLFSLFLSYYAGQVHLFVADLVCAFAIAGIDLAFPQVLRGLTHGLFTRLPHRSRRRWGTCFWALRPCMPCASPVATS